MGRAHFRNAQIADKIINWAYETRLKMGNTIINGYVVYHEQKRSTPSPDIRNAATPELGT